MAITETYIPFASLEGLKQDGIDFKITMSMTPPLVSMLRDPLARTLRRSLSQARAAELEYEHNVNNGHIRYLAEHYATEFKRARDLWERYDGDLVTAFKQFQDSNNLESLAVQLTVIYR